MTVVEEMYSCEDGSEHMGRRVCLVTLGLSSRWIAEKRIIAALERSKSAKCHL